MTTQDDLVREPLGLAADYRGLAAEQRDLAAEQRGFTIADILWAIGIWSVIICLSPVIVFYVLMVA